MTTATYQEVHNLNQKNIAMLEQIRDTLIEMNRVWEQLNCNHAFSDEHHDTACYKCGLEVNF